MILGFGIKTRRLELGSIVDWGWGFELEIRIWDEGWELGIGDRGLENDIADWGLGIWD